MNVVPNIQEILQKLKSSGDLPDFRVSLLILLVALGSFWLGKGTADTGESGRITVHAPESLVIVPKPLSETASTTSGSRNTPGTVAGAGTTTGGVKEGAYVGSKNGDKYHLPWCSGALRIKEENKVWFASKEEAERAGYTPASNCKGI